MPADKSSIIIKKIKKSGHGGGHGGAWKVAYADFVTAMMAFFLLLWLLNSVTQEQLEGISNYFAPQSVSKTTSGAGEVLGGLSMIESGGLGTPGITMDLPTPSAGSGGTPESTESEVTEDQAEEVMKRQEEEQFQQAEEALRQAIENVPALQQLSKSLLIDSTPEGLRVQIADQEGLAMFPRGRANMYDHTRKVLQLISQVVQKMPQKMAIEGHTDSTPFVGGATGYGNWELSADRANASRRVLAELGVTGDRISRVVGKAAEEPLLADDPENARNRRISIILLRGSGQEDGMPPAGG